MRWGVLGVAMVLVVACVTPASSDDRRAGQGRWWRGEWTDEFWNGRRLPRGIAGLIVAALSGVCALVALAQQPGKVPRIGYLSLESSPAAYLEAFNEGLRRLGYVEGRSIVIEKRLAEGKTEKLAPLASELVALKLDAIVGADGPSARALSSVTKSIPIVMGVSGDPVGLGLAISLARPGGNATGVSLLSPELAGKRLQFLREVSPRATRVAVVTNRVHAGEEQEWNAIEAAARSLNISPRSSRPSLANGPTRSSRPPAP